MIPHKNQIFNKLGALCRDLNFVPIAQMRDKLTCIINRGKDSTKKLETRNVVYKLNLTLVILVILERQREH